MFTNNYIQKNRDRDENCRLSNNSLKYIQRGHDDSNVFLMFKFAQRSERTMYLSLVSHIHIHHS